MSETIQRRVVVTGLGLVSPLGNSTEASWQALCAGKSGAGKISKFDATGWPVHIACEVKDFTFDVPSLAAGYRMQLNSAAEFGFEAAWQAMLASGLQDKVKPDRFGVAVGAGIGAIKPQQILQMLRGYQLQPEFAAVLDYLFHHPTEQSLLSQNHPGSFAAALARFFQAEAFFSAYTTACAAGAQAIGYGYRAVKENRADAVLAGGADSLSGELLLAGFCLLGVLSKSHQENPHEASRPFSADRDGFVAGEGAGMLVLEEYEHAVQRRAPIICEITGYGESENAFRMTDLPSDGHGAITSMRQALGDAGVSAESVSCINTHGTSTEQNDRVEELAIQQVFADGRPAVTANKSAVGHFVAASGAAEAVFSCLSIRDQTIPPVLNYRGGSTLDIVAPDARKCDVRSVLSNSFGFGGTNASILFSKYEV